MADILRFEYNVPEQIALKYATGREVEGRYGPQVMYSLTDGRVMYLDPNVAEKITELGVGAGETLNITKRERKDGRKRAAEYVIERPQAPPVPVPTNGRTALAAVSASATAADPLSVVFRAAIDTLMDAERYASSAGFRIEFGPEDVRALAISLYINATRSAQPWQR